MTDAIRHRGPDDSGVWIEAETGLALGHRRLSIVDLSPEGHQPMTSPSGRYVIVFNGEVYNHHRLRDELGSTVTYRGHSDTEVMLAAIERWGLVEATRRFIGMFAFALWDREDRRLSLVRDRLGIKPLYWGVRESSLVFGSELRALQQYPVEAHLNPAAIVALLRTGAVPAPLSIYAGVYKQLPGTILTFSGTDLHAPVTTRYWDATQVALGGLQQPFVGTPDEAISELDAILRDAVRLRMIADVPLGAFLSGGIDSSTIVALMQSQSTQRVRTFSIGFGDEAFNESVHARAVAQVLGTEHTELRVDAAQALEVVPNLPLIYDEPFADSSQIPTYLVSRLTRREVTVALSGDGGDELFGGYNRHVWIPLIWSAARHVPPSARARLARALEDTSPGAATEMYARLEAVLPKGFRVRIPGEKLKKLGLALACGSEMAIYERMTAHWVEPDLVLGAAGTEPPARDASLLASADTSSKLMLHDLLDYLPNDILTKVDRASMAVALEARVPFLDHRVVEHAWRLPRNLKIRGTKGKWILRRLLGRYVPESLFERPKMGFGVPLAAWLRGPLRPWAEALLDSSRLHRDGLLRPGIVRAAWEEHLSGKRDRHHELWIVLMLNAWLDCYRTGTHESAAA